VRDAIFIPDPQIYWIPIAYAAACRAVRRDGISAVLCSGPPFSTFILGRLLRARFRVPLILDYRDVWQDHPWWPAPRWRRPIERWMEGRLLSAAGLVLINHDSMRKVLLGIHPRVEPRCIVLPNGFDPEEMGPPLSPTWRPGDRFEIVYAGTFYGPVAGIDDPGEPASVRRPAGLFAAVGALARRGAFGSGGARVTFVGAKPGTTEAATLAACARECGVDHLVEILPRMEKADVVPRLRAAHLLLNIVYHTEAQITQKVYDYLHLEIPVLSLIRRSEVNSLVVRTARAGPVVDPGDVAGIEKAIESILEAYKKEVPPVVTDRCFVDQFDVRAQANILDARIRSLAPLGRGSPRVA
jgi:glycosyltransferase involved in cell wall biosynthesis